MPLFSLQPYVVAGRRCASCACVVARPVACTGDQQPLQCSLPTIECVGAWVRACVRGSVHALVTTSTVRSAVQCRRLPTIERGSNSHLLPSAYSGSALLPSTYYT